MAALPISRTPRGSPVHHCPNRRCSGEMGRRMARAAAMLSLCSTLVGVASAGVYVFPAASVVGADGTKRAGSSRVREVPFLYGGDPADAMRAGGQLVDKRASNLGSRLMCQLDSRNCGTFNMGKKFGRFSWLRSADSTWRRLQYELGGHRWERGVEAGGDAWREDGGDGGSLDAREKRPLQESEPNDDLQILRVE